MFTHGLSDMALWAGLAICGSPLQGDDVQKFTFSSTSHCAACLLNKAALMRYQALQLHSHCTACLLNKAALIRYQAPEASCASDKPVRHRLCRSLGSRSAPTQISSIHVHALAAIFVSCETFFRCRGFFCRSPGGIPWVWFCVLGFFVLENVLLLPGVFGGPLVEFPLCGSCPPHRGLVCVNRPGTRTLSRGTQHFTGTVSNEATSEVGYPAWPAGRTCLSFLFLTVFLSCSLLLPGFCSAL